jgi:hypothetical protein
MTTSFCFPFYRGFLAATAARAKEIDFPFVNE